MTIEIALVSLLSFVLLVLGVAYSYRGRRLDAAEKKVRDARYREELSEAQAAIKDLENKSRESSSKADQLLSDYHKRFTPAWRPGDSGPETD